MVDRQARYTLSKIISAYLNEEITAFQFDDKLQEAACSTNDRAVKDSARMMWYFYDDLKDHKVNATKEVWDYFQRVLLLLESDGELEITKVRRWSIRQCIATIALTVFICIAIHVGWGQHLYAVSIPFGVVSILLSRWRSIAICRLDHNEIAVYPFGSASELLSVRRRVSYFSKTPYPVALQSRRIREPEEESIMWIQFILTWLLYGPIALLFQAMPETDRSLSVRIP